MEIAVIHDIGESEIGDVAHRAVDDEQEITSEEKAEEEKKAVNKIQKNLNRDIKSLWEEYEERESEEARFVKDMDMIDMCLQALKYEKQGRYDPEEENENFLQYEKMDEFFATTRPRLKTETGRKLFEELQDRYQEIKS